MIARERDTLLAALRCWATLRRDPQNEIDPALLDIAGCSGAALTADEADELADRIADVARRDAEVRALDHQVVVGFGVQVSIYRSSVDGTPMVDIDTLADEDVASVRIHLNDEPIHEHPELVSAIDAADAAEATS